MSYISILQKTICEGDVKSASHPEQEMHQMEKKQKPKHI